MLPFYSPTHLPTHYPTPNPPYPCCFRLDAGCCLGTCQIQNAHGSRRSAGRADLDALKCQWAAHLVVGARALGTWPSAEFTRVCWCEAVFRVGAAVLRRLAYRRRNTCLAREDADLCERAANLASAASICVSSAACLCWCQAVLCVRAAVFRPH